MITGNMIAKVLGAPSCMVLWRAQSSAQKKRLARFRRFFQ
jgi:hypothetical protein